MLKKLLSVLLVSVVSVAGWAQELNCKVVIKHEKISGTDPSIFTAMQKSVSDFVNTHKWTNDNFAVSERIDCNIMFNLTGKLSGDDNGYTATMSIQASRPVYNSSYESPLVNYVDKDIQFDFSPFIPLEFDDNRISGTNPLASNLTAVLAYYSYLIVGLDYDSFAPDGGTDYFKKAQNIVNNAPEQEKTITGWKAVDGTHNRYWLIDQLLNNRFEDVRKYWYSLHRLGLDNLYSNPKEAQKNIYAGIYKLFQVNKENPNSILLQFFFNAKSDEITHLIAQIPNPADRTPYITLLSQIDVPDADKYNSLKQ